jgi:hypothetical protein
MPSDLPSVDPEDAPEPVGPCVLCGKVYSQHYSAIGKQGKGNFCTTDPDDLNFFVSEADAR